MKIPGIACTELAEVLPELVEGSYCDCLRQAQAAV